MPGWTLDESSDTDLILYTFDPTDTLQVYLLSFPLLREAARRFLRSWLEQFGSYQQSSTRGTGSNWTSECTLVPASIVEHAIGVVQRGRRQQPQLRLEGIA